MPVGQSLYRMLGSLKIVRGRMLYLLGIRITYKDPLGKERKWESAERSVHKPHLVYLDYTFVTLNFLRLFSSFSLNVANDTSRRPALKTLL